MNEMNKKICELVANQIGTTDFNEETKLISTGLLDSFGVITLITEFEGAFGVEFNLEELEFEQFNTVLSIANLIKKMQSA